MILSFLALAYARPIGRIAANLRGVGEGDWDPKWKDCAKGWSIGTAVFAFYGLDFAVNALQASMRNLLLDVTPAEQLNEGNAWIGRMSHIGSQYNEISCYLVQGIPPTLTGCSIFVRLQTSSASRSASWTCPTLLSSRGSGAATSANYA